MTHPLHEVLEALESGHGHAKQQLDESSLPEDLTYWRASVAKFDAAISKVRLLMEEKQGEADYVIELLIAAGHVTAEKVQQAREIGAQVYPALFGRTLPAAPQLDTPCAIEAERAPVLLMTGYQLRAAAEFVNPDPGDTDQLESEVCIQWGPERDDGEGNKEPAGLRVWLADYPEEGSMALDPDKPWPPLEVTP